MRFGGIIIDYLGQVWPQQRQQENCSIMCLTLNSWSIQMLRVGSVFNFFQEADESMIVCCWVGLFTSMIQPSSTYCESQQVSQWFKKKTKQNESVNRGRKSAGCECDAVVCIFTSRTWHSKMTGNYLKRILKWTYFREISIYFTSLVAQKCRHEVLE